jgi:hypothetical protein
MCRENDVPCYRGSESDVLDRFYHAARAEKPAKVVRITADCPLIDPEVIDRVVRRFERGDLDYASNAMVRSYPDGWTRKYFRFPRWNGRGTRLQDFGARACDSIPAFGEISHRERGERFDVLYQHYRWTVDESRIWSSYGRCTRLFAKRRLLE